MSAQHQVNAHAHAAPKEAAATTAAASSSVWVSQQFYGSAVTQVHASGSGSSNLYWMNLNNSSALTTLDFIVTYKAGSPLNQEHQHFAFPGGGYGASVATPFAVINWGGGGVLGPAVLTVLANGVPVGSYNFTVVA